MLFRFTYGEGECVNEYICFEKVKPHLIDQFNIIITCSAIHSVYLFILFLMSITLYTVLSIRDKIEEKQQDTKEKVEDSVTKTATATSTRKVRTTKRANPIR